jgi:hypothetical protein
MVTLRAHAGVLIVETMFYPEELRELDSGAGQLQDLVINPQELDIAYMLIDALTEPFDPSKYNDAYRIELLQLITAKQVGAALPVPAAEKPAKPAVDLIAALKASLADARASKAPTPEPPPNPPRPRKARKPYERRADTTDADTSARAAHGERHRRLVVSRIPVRHERSHQRIYQRAGQLGCLHRWARVHWARSTARPEQAAVMSNLSRRTMLAAPCAAIAGGALSVSALAEGALPARRDDAHPGDLLLDATDLRTLEAFIGTQSETTRTETLRVADSRWS